MTYTADKLHGFNAVVEKSGTPVVEKPALTVSAVPTVTKLAVAAPTLTKVAYAAPALTKYAYAAPALTKVAYASPAAYYHH